MMLHDQSVMSAPCHMIAVMTDDSLYIGKFALLWTRRVETEHSRSRTTMRVQFDEAISYTAGKLEIECFEQH